MRAIRLSLVTGALLLALAAPALAGYPKTLFAAVQKAYAPKKVHLDGFCYKTFHGRLYTLVDVTYLRNDKAGSAAFRLFTKAGWFALWKDGKVLPAVEKRQRGHVRAVVKRLHKECP